MKGGKIRNLSPDALAKISTQYGIEPITIIEVQWVVDGPWISYADRALPGVRGDLLSLSPIDTVMTAAGTGSSQQVSIVLNDTSGDLKNIFDTNDIHKRPARVYQWFDGLDLEDKFLLFPGVVNTPIEWNEAERSFAFDIISKLEDAEVGFSAEEGNFDQIPDSLIGRPWPMIFGTVFDSETISMQSSIRGITQEAVGVLSGEDQFRAVDGVSDFQVAQALRQSAKLISRASLYGSASFAAGFGTSISKSYQDRQNQFLDQAGAIAAQLDDAQRNTFSQREKTLADAKAKIGPNSIRILGGEDFPQGIDIDIEVGSGIVLTGSFDCQRFRIKKRSAPEAEQEAELVSNISESGSAGYDLLPFEKDEEALETPYGTFKIDRWYLSAEFPKADNRRDILQHTWADAGSTVRLITDMDTSYLVGITPGEILEVKAYKKFEGVRKLVNVPNNLWSRVDYDYGDITAITVKLKRPLSTIRDQGWEDDIFVTFKSDIGPNTVDIIRYLIETYTDLGIDEDSFAEVHDYLDPFPSSFVLSKRDQILNVLDDIAFQARCAVYVKNDTVYLKYLPVRPNSVQTITLSDIEHKSLIVSTTTTEELVTKMDIDWRVSYATDDTARKMILRHNTVKYGVQDQNYDWYIYNQPDIILKAATFWLIRYSNTWKKVRFKGFLNLLNIETLDAVTLNLGGAFTNTLAIVESATFDSDTLMIDFEVWTPIKVGKQSEYKFAWPYDVPGSFPTDDDEDDGGFNVSGHLPIGSLKLDGSCPDGGGVVVGGPNIIFQSGSGRGDPTPADVGFVLQPLIPSGTEFDLIVTPRPSLDLTTPLASITLSDMPAISQPISINFKETLIVDPDRNKDTFTLDDVLKFDKDTETYAAKRAFLSED